MMKRFVAANDALRKMEISGAARRVFLCTVSYIQYALRRQGITLVLVPSGPIPLQTVGYLRSLFRFYFPLFLHSLLSPHSLPDGRIWMCFSQFPKKIVREFYVGEIVFLSFNIRVQIRRATQIVSEGGRGARINGWR